MFMFICVIHGEFKKALFLVNIMKDDRDTDLGKELDEDIQHIRNLRDLDEVSPQWEAVGKSKTL